MCKVNNLFFDLCTGANNWGYYTEEGLPLTWTSSNTAIATVNDGLLTIKKAGTVVITASQNGDGDYFPFNEAFSLTIGKAKLRITAESHAVNLGEEIPELTVKYEGFKYNDDVSCLITLPTVTTTATSESAIGSYPIVVSGAEAANYDISYINGTLSVIDETAIQNTLSTAIVEIRSGGSATISLELNNQDPIIMTEFFMQLPEGITVALDEDGYLDATLNSNRSNRHSLEVAQTKDGLYHFLVYSTRNNSLKGNEGEYISIKVICDEAMKGGTYQATLRNQLFNDANKKEIILPDYNFSIHVTDVLLGDVNGDWKINGSDIVEMVDHIMGRTSEVFVLAAADLTNDGVVNGSDLVEEISLVMSQGILQTPAHFNFLASHDLAKGLSLTDDGHGACALGVASGEAFVLTQMTLQLSEGQTLNDITADAHHTVEYRKISNNTYFVVCYSTRNSVFNANDHLVDIHYSGKGTIAVRDVMMVGDDRQETYFAPVLSGQATDIRWANDTLEKPADIYSINGYLVKKQATSLDGLSKGVYVINGSKMTIK